MTKTYPGFCQSAKQLKNAEAAVECAACFENVYAISGCSIMNIIVEKSILWDYTWFSVWKEVQLSIKKYNFQVSWLQLWNRVALKDTI